MSTGETTASVLIELLRLYDWRFELAKRESPPQFARTEEYHTETKRLLNQYGREKKAAWEAARRVLSASTEKGAPIEKCPDGQKCHSTTTGYCWGRCMRTAEWSAHHHAEVRKHWDRLVAKYADMPPRLDTSNEVANVTNDASNLAAGIRRYTATLPSEVIDDGLAALAVWSHAYNESSNAEARKLLFTFKETLLKLRGKADSNG